MKSVNVLCAVPLSGLLWFSLRVRYRTVMSSCVNIAHAAVSALLRVVALFFFCIANDMRMRRDNRAFCSMFLFFNCSGNEPIRLKNDIGLDKQPIRTTRNAGKVLRKRIRPQQREWQKSQRVEIVFLKQASERIQERRPCWHYTECISSLWHSLKNRANTTKMTEQEIIQIQNEVYTKIIMDEFRRQRAEGVKEYLLDKYEMDRLTKERLKQILGEGK